MYTVHVHVYQHHGLIIADHACFSSTGKRSVCVPTTRRRTSTAATCWCVWVAHVTRSNSTRLRYSTTPITPTYTTTWAWCTSSSTTSSSLSGAPSLGQVWRDLLHCFALDLYKDFISYDVYVLLWSAITCVLCVFGVRYFDAALKYDAKHRQSLFNSAVLLQELGQPEMRATATDRYSYSYCQRLVLILAGARTCTYMYSY